MRQIHLVKIWDTLRTSYWFVPGLLSSGAAGLALLLVQVDQSTSPLKTPGMRWIWSGGPEAAREILSTIAGSTITVTGVTFSITIVALTLASSQFGPRLLRNFMRDTGNQIVLGTFVASFVYSLLVLRTVRGPDAESFTPHLSVTVGVLLALVSVSVLIYFVHHISESIQAEHLVATVARELDESIDRLYPEQIGQPEPPHRRAGLDFRGLDSKDSLAVESKRSGYLQAIDDRELMRTAARCDLLLQLLFRPGDFIPRGAVLARAWPAERCGPPETGEILDAFVFGRHRTPTQDVEYSVRQLAEVAVRALSPSLNDPYTAVTCLDWLGSSLRKLACRRIPSALRDGPDGRLRLIADHTDFVHVADAGLHPIRHYGRSSPMVMIHFLEVIADVAQVVRRPDDRESLRRHADLAHAAAREAIPDEADRRRVGEHYRSALRALSEPETVEREKEEALRQAAQEAP